MNHVVVVGSANMDLVVRQPRPPRPGETLAGTDFRSGPGGKGLNQAVAAALAGGDVAFVGAVGDDAHGRALRRVLARAGVAVDALRTVGTPTGTAHVSVLDGGENTIVVVPGANGELTSLDDAGRSAIRRASWVVLQFELPEAVVLGAARLARQAGARVVLTPAPVRDTAPELLGLVDLLVLNGAEAQQLGGSDDVFTAAHRLAELAGAVVVTLGARGALLVRDRHELLTVPAHHVQPVDTTGAGDAFVGATVARLSAGHGLEDALTWASAAAGLSVTRHGACLSIPTAHEVELFRTGRGRSRP